MKCRWMSLVVPSPLASAIMTLKKILLPKYVILKQGLQ